MEGLIYLTLFILAMAALSRLSDVLFQAAILGKYKKNGRYVDAASALRRVSRGIGFIIDNRSNVPGCYWWCEDGAFRKNPLNAISTGVAKLTDLSKKDVRDLGPTKCVIAIGSVRRWGK